MDKKVIILRGPSGIGKTTVAKALKERLGDGWGLIDVDQIKYHFPIKPDKSNRIERAEIAHDVARYYLRRMVEAGYPVIIEEMFKPRFNNEIVKFLRENHIPYLKVYLTAPVEEIVARSQAREKKIIESEIRRHFSENHQLDDDDLVVDTGRYDALGAAELIAQQLEEFAQQPPNR